MEVNNTLPLYVKLDGKTIPIQANIDWSILQLKQHLYLHSNKSPKSLKVIFAGSELPNTLLLKNCHLAYGTVVHVVVISAEIDESDIHESTDEIPRFTSTTNLIGPSQSGIRQQTDGCKERFYVYCKSNCLSIKPGKLRVRCKSCKEEAFQIFRGPNDWEDVLLANRINGKCHLVGGCGNDIAEFFFKCAGENMTENSVHNCLPLPLLRSNIQNVQCLLCVDVCEIVLVFPCSDSHVVCAECFGRYCQSNLDSRQFHLIDPIGYTLSCPGLGETCSRSYIKEIHHFLIIGARQYERYKNFATEEFILQNGGIFCPGEGCGNGLLLEENESRKVICHRSRGGCGMVFCRNCRLQYHDGGCDQSNISTPGATSNAITINERQSAQSRWLDEMRSRDTINRTAKACPRCKTPTEKSGGCNHMTCTRCNFEWCWICLIAWGRNCEADHWFLAR